MEIVLQCHIFYIFRIQTKALLQNKTKKNLSKLCLFQHLRGQHFLFDLEGSWPSLGMELLNTGSMILHEFPPCADGLQPSMDPSAICDPRMTCIWVKAKVLIYCVKGDVLSDKMPYKEDYNFLGAKKQKVLHDGQVGNAK